MKIRRHVIFRSTAFNTTESKDYFINKSCFGDDVASWLIQELRARGIQVDDKPEQEDFGWCVSFRLDGTRYWLLISYRPGGNASLGDWMCTVERVPGVLGFLTGGAKRGIKPEAPRAIHGVLSASPKIQAVRWFSDKDHKSEENPQPAP